MKKIIVLLLLSIFFTPALAAASQYFGIEPTLGQLLTRQAAINAMLQKQSVSCVLATNQQLITAGAPFIIAWGSYGADPSYVPANMSAWANNGEQIVVIDSPEKRKYEFDFYGAEGHKVTCTIVVDVQSKS